MEEKIQTNTPETTPQPSPIDPPPIKHSPKAFIITGILLVLCLIGIAGYQYVNHEKNINQKAVHQTNNITPSPTSNDDTANSDLTANWKPYTNEQHGFEFQYPPDYIVDTETHAGGLILNHIITQEGPHINSVTDCQGDCPGYEKIVDVNIGNLTAQKIYGYFGSVGGTIPESFIRYELQNPYTKEYIEFTLHELPQDLKYQDMVAKYGGDRPHQPIDTIKEKEFDQILSTFKFTHKDPVTYIKNWKTYENETYGISFQYPSTLRECCGIGGPFHSSAKDLITLGNVPENDGGSGRPFDGIAVYIDSENKNISLEQYLFEEKNGLKEVCAYNPDDNVQTEFQKIISGQKALATDNYCSDGNQRIYLNHPINKNKIIISWSGSKEFDPTINKILSTFIFK